jgi:glutamate-1-semialdehyde 2,1-aminomutase
MPQPGFLQGLRDVTTTHDAVLIFDEVMTGFRVAPGGAVERFGVTPDLITFGKVVGGGFPLAAYAGKREIMEHVAPAGSMYQAGTLSGNPVATASGIATLKVLARPGEWDKAAASTTRLIDGLIVAAERTQTDVQASTVGTMAGFFFTDSPVHNYDDARKSDTARFGRFFNLLVDSGVYFAPSQFEALFLSTVHSNADLDETLEAVESAFVASASS